MASELTAARQEMMKASYKLDVVQRQMGDLQERMNRMETLLRGLVNSQARATDLTTGRCAPNLRPTEEPRTLPDLNQPAELELEMDRGVEDLRQISLNSTQGIQLRNTPDGNFNSPSTGYSFVQNGWDQDQGSDWARQWPQNLRSYLNPPQFQYQARQWDPNLSKERVLCVSTVDADLPSLINMNIEQMGQTTVKATTCTVDGHNVDWKPHQILDMTEDEAHFHMKQVVRFTKDWNEANQHGKYIYGWLAKEEDYKSGDLKTVADQNDFLHMARIEQQTADGILVPGGFGHRGVKGKILAAKYARENNVPYLGICPGMQLAVVEFAHHVVNFSDANSTEFDPSTKTPCVIFMPEGSKTHMGETMRLGSRRTFFKVTDCRSAKLYGNVNYVDERQRHRYEVNPDMVSIFENAGLQFVGKNESGRRMEIIEILDHRFFIGVQFHPEFKSRPSKPYAPFVRLIAASSGQLDHVQQDSCNGHTIAAEHPLNNGSLKPLVHLNGHAKKHANGVANGTYYADGNGEHGYCFSGQLAEVVRIFKKMSRDGTEPNVVTYNLLMDYLCNHGRCTVASTNGTANGIANTNNSSLPRKQTHQNLSVANNGSYGRGPLQGGPSASNYGHNGLCSPIQWYDGPVYSNGHQRSTASSTSYGSNSSAAKNQDQRPTTNLMGMHVQIPSSGMGLTSPSYTTRMYLDSRFYGQYGPYENTQKVGLGYGSNVYNSRNNGRWGVVDTKYKPRGRAPFVFGSENQDGFTELNRGPRSGGFKHQKPLGPTVTIAVKGQALPTIGKQENSVLPDNGQFNQEGFPETFFIIKSYSEDDVHKSVKYNVWASTPNGNKKLDAGYREAQENLIECPVFLLFSVNTSDRFVGVAEMVGPVDFDKTVDYWQQDKWNGCFPVKWHIVKDVPNNILKHITLDNNDNYHCSWWKRQVAQSSHAAYNFAPLLTEWITTSGAVSPETTLTASEEGDKMLRMGYQPGRPGFDRKKLLLYAIICGCRWQIDRLLKDLPTLFNTIEDFLWFKLSALWEYTSTSSSDVLNEGLLPYTLEDLQNYLNKFEPSYYTKSGKDPLVYPYVLFLSIQLLSIILYLSKEVGEEGYHVDAVHISIALADHGVLPDGVGSGRKMCVIDACAEAASIIRQYGSIHLCNGNLDLALEYYAQAAAALGGREVSWIGQGNADFIKGTFPGFYSQTIKSWFPEEHT